MHPPGLVPFNQLSRWSIKWSTRSINAQLIVYKPRRLSESQSQQDTRANPQMSHGEVSLRTLMVRPPGPAPSRMSNQKARRRDMLLECVQIPGQVGRRRTNVFRISFLLELADARTTRFPCNFVSPGTLRACGKTG